MTRPPPVSPAVVNTELIEPHVPGSVYPQRVAHSKQGMVVTAQYRASEAGAAILSRGGNAVDAAVAAAFALGVCEPAASGLGGQSMLLIYDADTGRKIAFDGSSRAPNRVEPGPQPNSSRLYGHKATTVPSTPAVLGYVLNKYGTMPLAEILQPAIRLAKEGYRITDLQRSLMRREIKNLRNSTAAPFYLRKERYAYRVGALFRQPVLARTLRRLARAGIEDFYQGRIARSIYKDMERNGGYIRADDLAQIPWPIERRPLTTKFGDWRIFTMPPPGAGPTLIEILQVLNQIPESLRDISTPKGALMLAEILRRASLDRSDRPYDANLHPQEYDSEKMTMPNYAKRIARRIRSRLGHTGETTHLSVMDAAGNMVALTQSIERVYGSCTVTPELGFLYNNYMSTFEYQDISHPYYLRPNAAPWASVAPTLVFRGRWPWLALGSPSSQRIVSAIAQVLLHLQRGASPFDAIDGPRLHCSEAGKVSLELSRMRDDIPDLLEQRGFTIDERDPYSFYLGCVALVMREHGGAITGVADPRRDGSASRPRP